MRKIAGSMVLLAVIVFLLYPVSAMAQGTLADYERANGLRIKIQGLAINIMERPTWIEKTSRFWFRKSVKGGNEFVVMDAATLTKAPAFDHARLAATLAATIGTAAPTKPSLTAESSAASAEKITAVTLPFTTFRFADEGKAVEFEALEFRWRCELSDYSVKKLGPVERRSRGGGGLGQGGPPAQATSLPDVKASPDGKWEAYIKNFNVFLREKDKKEETPISFDGSEGNYYVARSMVWSPDSTKLIAIRLKPGYHRMLQYVESSPADQLQPKYSSIEYAKPGDALDIDTPVLFHVDTRRQINIDNALFPNPYDTTNPVWRKDGRAFTFEYNQRGHQVYRIIEVEAATGKARALVSEEPKTFFSYSGKKYRFDLADGKEIIWMSERDGWNHLYLYDGATGQVKVQITKGDWVVRGVDKVDEAARRIWFRASGMKAGQDPYFIHYYLINFDGTGLTALTEGDGTHTVTVSPDAKYYVDTWSRVDLAPTSELRTVEDRKVLATVEKADIQELAKAGWRAPEVFTSKGRDGKTDIWGVIYRPLKFDKAKKYPVIENIYAGPHDSFVPKAFGAFNAMQSMAELGFIVVQVDGMGTSNRSKAFHDVCWKNLGDAGFPDRILWHKAIAAKYPSYDISRVGIFGTSAGGQSALGGLLFHPEFYKAGVASCGCHDNRMDKIWWNEQWMGWPLGPEYAAASNVDNAWRLQGKLMLYVGEMDTNVDPASTLQVVNALIKANKAFDFLVLPGSNHTGGGVYGDRKRYDFFVHNLLGVEPPDWNRIGKK